MILRMHLLNVTSDWKDRGFGMDLTVTERPTDRLIDSLAAVTINGVVPANSTTFVDHVCPVVASAVLHPFNFAAHVHALTQCVSAWKVDSVTGQWSLIGTLPGGGSNNAPVVDSSMVLRNGDLLVSRCTVVNRGPRDVGIG